MTVFGDPEFSFSFQLSEQKKLIKEDTHTVLENLKEKAYHSATKEGCFDRTNADNENRKLI